MKVTFAVNYSGYLPILRSILLLVKSGKISLSQLGPYICFIMQVDFDMRHPNFGVILRDDKQLAKEFGVNQTTIYRTRKALIRKGLLSERDGKTLVPNFYMFVLDKVNELAKLPLADMQALFAKPQEYTADIESLIANKQKQQPEKLMQSSMFPSNVRSLSEEDVDWINKNVKEER